MLMFQALQTENCRLNDELSSVHAELERLSDHYDTTLTKTHGENLDLKHQVSQLTHQIADLELSLAEVGGIR